MHLTCRWSDESPKGFNRQSPRFADLSRTLGLQHTRRGTLKSSTRKGVNLHAAASRWTNGWNSFRVQIVFLACELQGFLRRQGTLGLCA